MSILINGSKYKILGFEKLSIENNIYYKKTQTKCALSGVFTVPFDELTVQCYDSNPFPGATSITWGDGTETDLTTTSVVSHTYPSAGNYTFKVYGEGMVALSSAAFYNSNVLKKLEIGESITLIEHHACYNCFKLSELVIGPNVNKIDANAFYGCQLFSLVIPEKVTFIGSDAFSYCTSLTDVIIGSAVQILGSQCFYHCENLSTISLGSSINLIGTGCFNYCYSLGAITFPSSLQALYPKSVSNCTYLNTIIFEDTSSWYLDESSVKTYTTLIDVNNGVENALKLKSDSGEWSQKYLHKKPE